MRRGLPLAQKRSWQQSKALTPPRRTITKDAPRRRREGRWDFPAVLGRSLLIEDPPRPEKDLRPFRRRRHCFHADTFGRNGHRDRCRDSAIIVGLVLSLFRGACPAADTTDKVCWTGRRGFSGGTDSSAAVEVSVAAGPRDVGRSQMFSAEDREKDPSGGRCGRRANARWCPDGGAGFRDDGRPSLRGARGAIHPLWNSGCRTGGLGIQFLTGCDTADRCAGVRSWECGGLFPVILRWLTPNIMDLQVRRPASSLLRDGLHRTREASGI